MDRLTFLRSMLGNTALLTLPPLHLLSTTEQDRLAWTQDAHSIFVFDTYVRGFQHYEGARVLARMKELDALDLVREYDNPHDSNAVAVYWEGHKLGFLPMGENISLAYMLDHGLLLECSVVYTQSEARSWEQCFIAVHLLLPATPSFTSYLEHYMERPDAGYKRRPEYGGTDVVSEEEAPATARTVEQVPALHLLGETRFVHLLHHVADTPYHSTPVAKITLGRVDKEGMAHVVHALQEHRLILRVLQLSADAYEITFGTPSGECSRGNTWSVVYDAQHHILEAVERSFWMS